MSKPNFTFSEKRIITIFSNDRPDRVHKILPHLETMLYEVHLIDDSASKENQIAIRMLCNNFNVNYHGVVEQQRVIEEINSPLIQKFVTRLGKKEWSLGYNRNYAIIYGLFLGIEKIIFMDDDVIVKPQLLESVFDTLSKVPFVGTKITLMPDDSVIGHIYRAGGKLLPQYVSGTFLGINLQSVRHYFLNIYNEDWIWLFLENNGKNVNTISFVKQLRYDPFKDWKSKIFFQEFGEIVWDGLFYSPTANRKSKLVQPTYWENALKIRMQELEYTSNLNLPDHLKSTADAILKNLFEFHLRIVPDIFARKFQSYFQLLDDWQSLLTCLRSFRALPLQKFRDF